MGYTYKQGGGYSGWIRQYAKTNWFLIALLLFLALIAVGLELITPLPFQILIDDVFGDSKLPSFIHAVSSDKFVLVFELVGIYIAIHLFASLFTYAQSLIQIKANQRIDRATMQESFEAATRIPYNDVVRENPSDDLYAITSQSQMLSSYILDNSVSVFQASLTLVGATIVLVNINIALGGVIVLAIPLLVFIIVKFSKIIEKRSDETETAHGKIYTFIAESLEKLRTIQSYAYENKRLMELNELVHLRNRSAFRRQLATDTYSLLNNIVIIVALTATLLIGSLAVAHGTMTVGILVVVLAYMSTSFDQVSVFTEIVSSISSQKATLQQAFVPIERGMMFKTEGQTTPIAGSIQFRDVMLKKGSKEVFSSINLNIPTGSLIGIVGPSGAGKSTFIDSLLRFITPFRGQILIDGVDIQSYDLSWLRKNISLVEQEPDLFDGSINDNISLADPKREFDLLDIMAAGSVAELTEYLEEKHKQGDEMIDNSSLSGGQKQRIAIARAFYKSAPIIIMDEPTSALDPSVGHKVIDNVIQSSRHHTTIIITHDLSLLKKLPYVFVVGEGMIRDINELGGVDEYFRLHSGNL